MERPRNTFLLGLLLATMALSACGGSSKTEDAVANHAIISALPKYPDAQVYDQHTSAYYEDDGGLFSQGPLGHTTNVNYEVTEGTDQVALVNFYASRLQPDWSCRTERLGAVRLPSGPPGSRSSQQRGKPLPEDAVLILHCKRGSAIVGVNPDNLGATPPRYELVVDHADRTR